MPKLLNTIAVLCCCLPFCAHAQKPTYQKVDNGVFITYKNISGTIDQKIAISFIKDSIVHVKATPLNPTVKESSVLALTDTFVTKVNQLAVEEKANELLIKSKHLQVTVSLLNGQIHFLNLKGDTILSEENRDSHSFIPAVANGDSFYEVKQVFRINPSEGLYGLGQHQNGIMNYQDKQVTLLQYNTEVAVPMMVSTKNYGILWNNYSITTAGDTRALLPLSGLKLISKEGNEGWLTATYVNKENENDIFTERAESDIAYYDLSDQHKFPVDIDLAKSLVRYEGQFSSPFNGTHRLHFKYAGYIKVWIDGELVQNRWRESWNAGSFEIPIETQADKLHDIQIDWTPEGSQSYFGVKWQRPLPQDENKKSFGFHSEAGDGIDYYFLAGSNMDHVIGAYRVLTGKAPIMPKWVLGFWQSRERYKTQQEILDVAQEFRRRKIPIDNIVLDWSYWPEQDWGGQQFDLNRFPDPSLMIQKLHKENYKLMISVWPKFNEKASTFPTFMKNGWLYRRNITDGRKDWIGEGYRSTFYDPFNEQARHGFWDLLNENLYKKGVDAFWMDASEPDIHSNISLEERKNVFQPSIGSSTRYYNAFPLQNAKGIYEGQRKTDPNKRVFMLTRSGFAGQQRYAAATWSGDIASTWEDMRDQIAAGVNFSMSGLPYWTMDAGGFLVEKKHYHPNEADLEDWRELNSRWYQFGAFIPIFRAHGQFPFREPFHIAPEGHAAYNSMVYYIQLRYRLLPYYYSLAANAYYQNASILRGLPMEFGADPQTFDINDQFMVGSSLLVNPVTKKALHEREVYLPAGTSWYDLYSGKHFPGGQKVLAKAPYERIPVFVKAGSIVPVGPVLQHTADSNQDPITFYVYEGANGSFTLFEDDGITYDYEKGVANRIVFKYHNETKKLEISKREGNFTKYTKSQKFNVVLVSGGQEQGIDNQNKSIKQINYVGKAINIQL